jgi:hypothetical protein
MKAIDKEMEISGVCLVKKEKASYMIGPEQTRGIPMKLSLSFRRGIPRLRSE